MEPAAPQEEITQLAEEAVVTPPLKLTGWRHWLPYLMGIVFLVAAVAAGYSYYLNGSFPSYPTFNSTVVSRPLGTQIYYALQASAVIKGDSFSPRQFSVYRANPDGTGKTQLFLTESGFHNFYLSRDKKFIYDLTERRVSVYDLEKGGTRVVYGLENPKEEFNGFSFSRDDSLLARGVLTGADSDAVSSRMEVIDLKTGQATVLIPTKTGYGTIPYFWSSDNQKIYMTYGGPFDSYLSLSVVSRPNREVKNLDYIVQTGMVSPNGSYYAYADNAAGSSLWNCGTGLTTNAINFVNLDLDEATIFDSSSDHRFTVLGWSPDSTQFLYSDEKSLSKKDCEEKFAPAEGIIFNSSSKKTEKIASISAQLASWKTDKIKSEVKYGQTTLENNKLVVNDQTIETVAGGQEIKYIGFSE